jgi:uncharacterized RDD family membrane protein YckC
VEDRLVIETPEQVELSYELAGMGSRFIAGVVDSLLVVLLLVLALALFAFLGVTMGSVDQFFSADEAGQPHIGLKIVSWTTALFVLLVFAVFWGYHFFFETVTNGRTPGKKQVGLRVIRDGGYPITASAAAVRNLLRVVDAMPWPFYGVAGVSMLLSSQVKRLGDLAAGTVVVKERVLDYTAKTDKKKKQHVELGAIALVGDHDSRLTAKEAAVVRNFLERRSELSKEARQRLAQRIAQPLMERLGVVGEDPEMFLSRLVPPAYTVLSQEAPPAGGPPRASP